MLREAGYTFFPAVVPRWATSGGDVYGTGPGMEALGDCKQLQHQQLCKAQAIDYKTKPPLQAPTQFKSAESNMLPGGISYVDSVGQGNGIRAAFEVNIDLQHLLLNINDVCQRIDSTFYADLFIMLSNDERSGITAREISERAEEKMLMLGPVLERLHNELLNPLIDIVFSAIVEARTASGALLPVPPDALQCVDLKVEFVSTLAQAQRLAGLSAVDRLLGMVGNVAQFKPDVVDKLDADQLVDVCADMLGTDPSLVVADDKVQATRQARAQAAQQEQQMQQMAAAPALQSAAGAVKDLSETDTGGENAFTDIAGAISGYGG